MLREVASLIARADTIVTFNGKSFDLPLLESRMIMNRIRVHVTDMPHLDLLHAARRVYKLRLGRGNLTALEEAVLGKTLLRRPARRTSSRTILHLFENRRVCTAGRCASAQLRRHTKLS